VPSLSSLCVAVAIMGAAKECVIGVTVALRMYVSYKLPLLTHATVAVYRTSQCILNKLWELLRSPESHLCTKFLCPLPL
jgi:hypothetical protein